MGTTNILDLNNRVSEIAQSYPADKVMMSDGVTSVEEAVDEVAERLTIGSATNGRMVTAGWVFTDLIVEPTAIYSFLFVRDNGMRHQLLVLGDNISKPETPIGLLGKPNESDNIMISKDDNNKIGVYISSSIGSGTYYIAKIADLIRIS